MNLAALYAQLHQRITTHPTPPDIRPWEWAPPHPPDVTIHTAPFDGVHLGFAVDDPPAITIVVDHPHPVTVTDVMLHEMAHLARLVADWSGDHDTGWHRLHNNYRHTLKGAV